jgi:putative tryptophan/tyrosine transport system substrate-binding protein
MSLTTKFALTGAISFMLMFESAVAANKKISAIFFEGCEKTCEGFKKAIDDSKFPVTIEIIDLKLDKTKIQETVTQIKAARPDLVLVYGTTATVAALGTLEKAADPQFINDIPVVFTAVADPVGSKVIESLAKTGRKNVTGTFNRVPEKLNIQAIKRLDSGFSKLGVLFNANEQNSVAKVKELQELSSKEGFEVLAVELKTEGKNLPPVEEISRGLQALKDQNVTWLYVGSSSYLNVNGKFFTEAATTMGIAVVSPYPALVTSEQALMSIAAPREEVGALAAGQSLKILRDGATPGDLPVEVAQHFTYTLNLDVAKQLNMKILNAPENQHTMTQDFFLSAQ